MRDCIVHRFFRLMSMPFLRVVPLWYICPELDKLMPEYSMMLSLVSKGSGSLTDGIRTSMEVFDLAKVFKKN